MEANLISRRSCLTLAAAASLGRLEARGGKIPVGLELSSIRDDMAQDPMGAIRAVAKMGYESVEFWGTFVYWTPKFAKNVRKLLDDLGLLCHSTLADAAFFSPEKLQGIIDLNQILGSKLVVMTDVEVSGFETWKAVADRLNRAAKKLRPLGMRAGYHNHEVEFSRSRAAFRWKCWLPTRAKMWCCSSISGTACREAETRSPGSSNTPDGPFPCIVRTGKRRPGPDAILSRSGKGLCRGKECSKPRRRLAASSII